LCVIFVFYVLTKRQMNERSNKMCNRLSGSKNNYSKSYYKSILQTTTQSNQSIKEEREVRAKSCRGRYSSTSSRSKSRPMNNDSIKSAVPCSSKSCSTRSSKFMDDSQRHSRRDTFNSVLSQRTNFSSILSREQKAMQTIFLNVSMFVFAWLPYALLVLAAQFAPPSAISYFLNPYTTSLPAVFAKASSIYNPVIYTLSSRECRIYFKKMFNFKK
jgi:hypothetical protein